MFRLLLSTLIIIVLLCCNSVNAQTDSLRLKNQDTTQTQITQQGNVGEDDDFNIFLIFFAVAFVGVMIGAAIVGSFAAALIVVLMTLFISAGVFSVSLLAGFYKKSVPAGLKTFVIIICMIGGAAIGSVGLFFITKIFKLHHSSETALLTGALGGLAGGVLMGAVVHKMLKFLMLYVKKKMQIS